MEDDNIRRRAACDRCHTQKLKCPKAAGSKTCDRCIKAKAPCLYSPFRQKKEPQIMGEESESPIYEKLSNLESRLNASTGANITPATSTVTTGTKRKRTSTVPTDPGFGVEFSADSPQFRTEAEIDWTAFPNSLDVDPLFGDFDFTNGFPQLELFPTSVMTPEVPKNIFVFPQNPFHPSAIESNLALEIASTKMETSRSAPPRGPPTNRKDADSYYNGYNSVDPQVERDLVQSLSQLSIGLYDHYKTIPPQSVHTPGFVEDPENPISRQFASFTIDQTFQLTQDMLDIYSKFLAVAFEQKPSNIETISRVKTQCHTDIGSPSPAQIQSSIGQQLWSPTGSAKSRSMGVDHASVLLLLSCHTRLLDIYDELFQHMDVCVHAMDKAQSFVSCSFEAPQFSIGAYTPPPMVAATIQASILVKLASSLVVSTGRLSEYLKNCQQEAAAGPLEEVGERDEALKLSLKAVDRVKTRASNMMEHVAFVDEALAGFVGSGSS